MSATQAARLLAVFGLFLAVPGFAFEQSFGLSSQRGGNAQVQQPQAQNQGAGQRTGGQGAGGQQGRNDSGPWEWWKDDSVQKELVLSPKQVRDISRIFDTRVREMKPVNDEYQKQRSELDRLAKERTVEIAIYSLQVNRVEALRSELNKSRAVMFYAISRQLTAEQHTKLDDIVRKRFAARRAGGGGTRQ